MLGKDIAMCLWMGLQVVVLSQYALDRENSARMLRPEVRRMIGVDAGMYATGPVVMV